ncbi:MAG: NnrS family protein [Acidobacteria bacterium]|nr:NnrS family protein [Acidobacteriota bacterium]
MENIAPIVGQRPNVDRLAIERHSQRLAIAFIASGLFFMVLPGTFLGVWKLIDISKEHTLTRLDPAWLQAHGQAQIFGWIGSFIIGIGFYSLTKMQSTTRFPVLAGWAAWALWTSGITCRWVGGATGWHWRVLLPLSAAMELVAFYLFGRSLRQGRTHGKNKPKEIWLKSVIASTFAFLAVLIVNFITLLQLALAADSPALPHLLDQQMVVLALWGILVPTIFAFNARWLSIFIGMRQTSGVPLFAAYSCIVVALTALFLRWQAISAVAFLFAALLAIEALHVWRPAVQPAKLLHVHPTFPLFVRIAYVWLLLSCILDLLAVPYDHSGGIWGSSRHALTVGFVAGMVFAIGQRVLPAFCGMRALWSTQVMFWSLLLLNLGCALRVTAEPLAYENNWGFAWRVLPFSALIELTSVTLFALNLVVTLFIPPAHVQRPNSSTAVS